MNLLGNDCSQGGVNKSCRWGGFTLVEVMIGVTILAVVTVTLFALLTAGFAIVRLNRENLRATQIMLNRVEGLRLYNWSQLEDGQVPSTFSEYYYPAGTNSNQGTLFTGEVIIDPAEQNPPSTYDSTMMKAVTVRVSWTSGNLQHNRHITTYVSKYGLQNYLFAN